MRTIFLGILFFGFKFKNSLSYIYYYQARGPNFKKNVTLSPFKNVNIYPLICELTQIICKPHNGSISTFDDVLIQIEETTTTTMTTTTTTSTSNLLITTTNKSNINTFNSFIIIFTIFIIKLF